MANTPKFVAQILRAYFCFALVVMLIWAYVARLNAPILATLSGALATLMAVTWFNRERP